MWLVSEEEDGFLNGRVSKEEWKETGGSTSSGEVSFAFRLPPDPFLTEEVAAATLASTGFAFGLSSTAGVPGLGKTHFFFDFVQVWQEEPLPPTGRRQGNSEVAQRSHYHNQ